MSAEKNRQTVERVYLEAFNTGKFDGLPEWVAPGYVDHEAPPNLLPPGPTGMGMLMSMYRSIFPDLRFTIETLIASDDHVISRIIMNGTQAGPLFGLPPSNKMVSLRGIDIFRLADGKVTDHWGATNLADAAGLFSQRGDHGQAG